MNQEINIAPNTDVLSLIGLGNRPSVAGATLFTEMKMIKDLGREFISEKSNQKRHLGIFECPICGEHFRAILHNVKKGRTKCCKECNKNIWLNINVTHNLTHSRLHGIWTGMKQRCYNNNNQSFHLYGGRGIIMCDEWKNDFMSFYDWSIHNGYSDKLVIDRINNDDGYKPENCRWTTVMVNCCNKRGRQNTKSGFKGVFPEVSVKTFWRAEITWNRKRYKLGVFENKLDAVVAYNNFVLENHTPHSLNKI